MAVAYLYEDVGESVIDVVSNSRLLRRIVTPTAGLYGQMLEIRRKWKISSIRFSERSKAPCLGVPNWALPFVTYGKSSKDEIMCISRKTLEYVTVANKYIVDSGVVQSLSCDLWVDTVYYIDPSRKDNTISILYDDGTVDVVDGEILLSRCKCSTFPSTGIVFYKKGAQPPYPDIDPVFLRNTAYRCVRGPILLYKVFEAVGRCEAVVFDGRKITYHKIIPLSELNSLGKMKTFVVKE